MNINVPLVVLGIAIESPFDASLFHILEESVYQQHKWEVLGITSLLILQALLIVILVVSRSKQKRAEAEQNRLASLAQAEHQHLEEVVANLPGLVWESRLATDGTSRVETYVSSQVEKMLGYTVEEWMSDPRFWLSIIPEEERGEALERCDEILQGGQSGVIQFH